MARLQLLLAFVLLICVIKLADAKARGCGGQCEATKDCHKGLKCLHGECKDDPSKATAICSKSKKKKPAPSPLPPPSPTRQSPRPPPESPPGRGNQCRPSGFLHSSKNFKCADCCKAGKSYPQYKCSPPVTKRTPAKLTVNDFQPGGDGGGASSCDSKYHSNKEAVVALSTGWFENHKRCGQFVLIKAANGRSVKARVVDECDSVRGCDAEHGFYPPCAPDIMDGSPAVWAALGISRKSESYGWMDVTWSDL